MIPLGQRFQEKLRSPELRSRRASASACARSNELAHVVDGPNDTGNGETQPKIRPVSVPLFECGPNTSALIGGSSQATVSKELDHRSLDLTTVRYTSENLKTARVPPDTHGEHVKGGHDGRALTRWTPGKTLPKAQTKDLQVKQEHQHSDAGTFAAVVLAQRWLSRLQLQYTHPITRSLQQASEISYRQQRFIPESRIRDIIHDKVVQTDLSKAHSTMGKPSRTLQTMVIPGDYMSYRKILAILYLMKRPSKIRLFLQSGLCDEHLPLKKIQGPKDIDRATTMTSRRMQKSPSVRFKRLDDADEFLDRQWWVLAPIFDRPSEGVSHKDLECEAVLPFLSETMIAKEGGSSQVFKAKIHPDHHRLSQSDRRSDVFAIKTLNSRDDEAFSQEVTVLRKLSTKRHFHVHLITVLATYRHRAAYHLIFPWADADLFDYWKRHSEAPPEENQTGTWLIEQCRGLADGLNSIHRYATFSGTSILNAFNLPNRTRTEGCDRATISGSLNANKSIRNLFGRHGDLKPQNILWYPHPTTTGGHGILKITDFGVTRFNTENMWDTQKTGRLPNSRTYRSPESDLDGKLTTACDVWALGCVYLEFVTWYFGGIGLVERYGKMRLATNPRESSIPTDTFFSIHEVGGQKTADVKPAVLKTIEELREHQRCTEDFSNFLDMVKDDMLVVRQHEVVESEDEIPVLRKTASEPAGIPRLGNIRRKSCGDVFRRLGDIKPCVDQEEDLARQSAFELMSPVSQSHHTWPQRED